MEFIEYKESFGEYEYPEGFEETLEGLTLEQQTTRFRVTRRSDFAHTGWRERSIESGISLADSSSVTATVVKNGKIVGVMLNDDNGRSVFCGPEKCVCTYYAEDNNGAGYKTRIDYTFFVCVTGELDK